MVRVMFAAVILAVTVAACGGADGQGVSPPDPDEPVSTAPASPADGSPPSPQPSEVTPRPGMADVRARPFESAAPVGDGRTVAVRFWSGVEPCYVLDHVEVEETSEEVVITLYEGHDPEHADTACIEIAVLKSVTVELDAPVGDRRVVDGAAEAGSG